MLIIDIIMKRAGLIVFLIIQFINLHGQGRQVIDFNAGWHFKLGDDLQYRNPQFDETRWEEITLPHDWSILSDFGAEFPAGNAGGALPGGTGWYRKKFSLPKSAIGKQVSIHFGGAYRYTEVWLNGHYLGKHTNGYLSFAHDLTPYLNLGGQQNVISIRVDNSKQPNSRWYTGSGIYRDVNISIKDAVHILDEETFITTPVLTPEQGNLLVQTKITNPQDRQVGAVITLRDQGGRIVADKHVLVRDNSIHETLEISNPKLWGVTDPNLYQLEIVLEDTEGTRVDNLAQKVGFRTIKFDEKSGFYLNGESLKIHGVCLHHDLGALGAAFNKSAAKRQLVMMKEMGVNAIRTAHNPPAKEVLDLCDELGLLVYNEAYDMWAKRKNKFDYHLDFQQHHIADLKAFIKRDRNHPSVFMWSIGNEIREQFDSTGITLTKNMAAVVRELDPTRPVTAALTETNFDKNYIAQAKALDVLGFNYKYFDYDSLPSEFAGVPLLASETSSALETRGVYDALHDTIQLWPASSKDKFVVNGNADFTVSAYDNVAAYWGTSHERAWIEVAKRPFLAGTFVWTGFDYLGEPVPYPYPARSSYYGIVDLAGFAKDVYYMYQSEWTDKEVLHLLPHWNWKQGDIVDVWAYYNNADEVELFLNDKSLGRRQKSVDTLHASWRVAYDPGELKVVKYREGKVVQQVSRNTAGEAAKLEVTVHHDQFATGDDRDLYFVEVQLIDQQGNPVTEGDQNIEFLADQHHTVLGTDNGFQADLSGLHRPTRKTFKGKALAIVSKHDAKIMGDLTIKWKGGEQKIKVTDTK